MKASEAVPYSFNLHSLRPALTIAVRTSLLFKLVVTRSATGPNRTFVLLAANGSSEPTPDLLILRCVRSQHENYSSCVVSHAALRPLNQSLRQFPANAMMVKDHLADFSADVLTHPNDWSQSSLWTQRP